MSKKMVYVVKAYLSDEDAEGEPLNWSEPSENYYAESYERAVSLKEFLLSGKDPYYGDLVEDVEISDEPQLVEFV